MAKTRKCFHCKENIPIRDKTNLGHLLKYKDKFYHTECFKTLAESRVAANNRYSASWQEALDNIDQFIEDARQSIIVRTKTDPLNEYLIETYNVATLSARFWSMIADIGNGIYRRKRCKSIDCETLLEMWKHYQQFLLDTYAYNRSHGNYMDGEGRVLYDLAVLMGKYGEFIKLKAKEEAKVTTVKTVNKINYEALSNQKQTTTKTDDDILALMDEIF